MVLRKLFSLVGLGLVIGVAFAANVADRILDIAARLFAPISIVFSPDRDVTFASAGGTPLDAALQNSMRHEAAQHRRSADRNI